MSEQAIMTQWDNVMLEDRQDRKKLLADVLVGGWEDFLEIITKVQSEG